MTTRAVPHEAISASAGSGKTFQLAHRYLRLLASGVEPDRIAALTFSRKAAGEIFDSIVGYLCEAASSPEAAETTSERLELGRIPPAQYARLLRQLLANLHRLHIGTLDSFTVGILRSFPFELGIPPGISLMESGGADALAIQERVLASLYRGDSGVDESGEGLLEAFLQASFGRSEKRIEENVAALIGQYHTFYRLLPESDSWGEPGTIWPDGNPWGASVVEATELTRLLAEQGASDKVVARFGDFAEAASTYTARSAWSTPLKYMMEKLLPAMADLRNGNAAIQTDRNKTDFQGEAASCLLALMAQVVNTEIGKAVERTRGSYSLLSRYSSEYERVTRSTGSLTFEDAQFLLTRANSASSGATLSRFQGGDGRLYVDYRLDARLDHWLLDEFQDTSDIQWDILSNLSEEILQDDTGQRSLFIVGDVKQAIYGWRGGNPRLFGMLLDRYADIIQTRDLVESQRSCPHVIDMVNGVFSELPRHLLPDMAVSQWERFWQSHRSAQGPSRHSGVAALLEPPCDGGEYKPTREDRYQVVAALLDQIRPLSRGLSVAVLVRSNDNGKAIVEYLRAHCPGLPIVHEGRAAIIDNPVVAALLSLVKYAAHPGDRFAWRHLQMTPLYAVIQSRRLGRDTLPLRLLNQIHSEGFRGLFEDWGKALDSACQLDEFGQERLRQFLTAAGEFDTTGSRDCNSFLSFISKYELHEAAGSDAVRVMTVHQSKGLGFDVVILPELDDSNMATAREVKMLMGRRSEAEPSWLLANPSHGVAKADLILGHALDDANSAASFESLCLLYVAMTRAKRGLYVVTSFPGKTSRKFDQQAFLKRQLTGEEKPTDGDSVRVGGVSASILASFGDMKWYEECPHIAPSKQELKEPAETLPLAKRGSGRRRLTQVRPSDHDWFDPRAWTLFAEDRRERLEAGSAIHELLSRVEWLDETNAERVQQDWLAETRYDEPIARAAVAHFGHAIQTPGLRGVFQRPSHNAEARNEWRFDVVVGHRWLTGVFDRVVLERDDRGKLTGATIYDYKTDSVDSEATRASLTGHYGHQLLTYRDALAAITRLPQARIRMVLVYTDVGLQQPITG